MVHSSSHKKGALAQSISTFLDGQTLQTALEQAQDFVKHRPADVTARWGLFELLCVFSSWQRALKQLQICVKLDPTLEHTAQVLRDLIAASILREQVWQGVQQPVPVIELAPWMQNLATALAHHSKGQVKEEDQARHAALAIAPLIAGQLVARSGECHVFNWLTDTDTRLGPVCEVVLAGSYRWLAFSDIANLQIHAPKRLVDLVWSPVQMTLQHSPLEINGFIPARYQDLSPSTNLCDALLLARKTQWEERGETGVYAQGQKTWMTTHLASDNVVQQHDWSLFDIARIEFENNPLIDSKGALEETT